MAATAGSPWTTELAQVSAATRAVLGWLDEQSGYSSVGILGFSQGSAIAVECVRARSEAFVCAVILAGFVNPLPAPGDSALSIRRPPVFSGRCSADTVIPAPLVTATNHWLATHTRATIKTYPRLGHTVSSEEISDVATFLDSLVT